MSKIVYVCHYGTEKNPRHTSPAGVTLASYVIDCISELEKELTVFSPAQATSNCEIDRQVEVLNDNATIIFMKSFKRYGRKNLPMRFLQKIKRERELERELESLIEDGDIVIVYHSLSLMKVISKLRKKKNFKLILQVAEIYADVIENKKIRNGEIGFIKGADKYIFSSPLLEKELNTEKKEAVVCLGTYKFENKIGQVDADGKIHILYAGILDPRKGSEIAVRSSQYLDENYHIHILGFGTELEKKQLIDIIDGVKNKSKCMVTYDGCLSGNEYKAFVQRCQIGLCPQNPSASFTATSFPSKILVYLANGLRVVSVKISAIENSPVGQAMYFYKEQSPEEIANVIKAINLKDDYDSRELIKELNQDFVQGLGKLLKE